MKEKRIKHNSNRKCLNRGCPRYCTFGRVFGCPEYCKKHIPMLLEPTGDFEKIPFLEEVNNVQLLIIN